MFCIRACGGSKLAGKVVHVATLLFRALRGEETGLRRVCMPAMALGIKKLGIKK
jgi:hypothetical protein